VIQSNIAKQTTNIPALSDQNVFWILHSTAINPDTEAVAEYDELSKSNTEEFGRLAQGLGPDSEMPEGTDTLFFIHPNQMPNGRKATYLRIACADRPEKLQPRRAQHTIGGDQINYPGSTSTKTADLTTVKTLFNHVISTPDGCFMTVDLKDFFLGTPLEDPSSACYPSPYYGALQSSRPSDKWFCLCQSSTRNVWSPASCNHSQQTVTEVSRATWIPTSSDYARFVAT
jgi:hypothetical protein